jgi:hypothetical protein
MISRLKFPIQPLVKEMLDQLPADVWSSSTTTFLDPAMGGGQFLVEIQTRLRAAGHSDENIAERMYGCEINKLRVNYTKNNKKLVTNNLFITDFLSYDWGNMNFDVIVGNPPYVDDTAGRNPLYDKFVEKSFALSTNSMGLIIPSAFTTSNEANGDVVRNIVSDTHTKCIKFLGGNAFSGASVDTLYFVRCQDYQGPTKIQSSSGDYNCNLTQGSYVIRDQTLLSILKKCNTLDANTSWIKFHRIDRMDTTASVKTITKIGRHDVIYEDTDQSDPYIGAHRAVTSFLPNSPNHLDLMTYAGPDIAVKKGYTVCCMPTEKSAKNLVSYLTTSFCRVIHNETKTSRSLRSPQLKFIPHVDLSISWTDALLYQHFGLDQNEIKYIESKLQ